MGHPIPYETDTFTVAAGATVEWPGSARWVAILATDNDTVSVSFRKEVSFFALPKGILVPIAPATDGMLFRNDGGAPATFTVARGMGEPIQDNRLVVVGGTLLQVTFPAAQPVTIAGPNPLPVLDAQVHDATSEISGTNFGGGVLVPLQANGALIKLISGWCENKDASRGEVVFAYNAVPRFTRRYPVEAGKTVSIQIDRPWYLPAGKSITVTFSPTLSAWAMDCSYTPL